MSQIDNFRNQVFCRRDSNQRAARKLWNDLKLKYNENEVLEFEVEWSHYLNGELDSSEFGYYFKKLLI